MCQNLKKKSVAKRLMEEQERIKGQVNSWETRLKKMEEKHNFMDEWRQRNNLLIFRIKECRQESYFNILKITEDIMRYNDTESGHFELAYRKCPQAGQEERKKTSLG